MAVGSRQAWWCLTTRSRTTAVPDRSHARCLFWHKHDWYGACIALTWRPSYYLRSHPIVEEYIYLDTLGSKRWVRLWPIVLILKQISKELAMSLWRIMAKIYRPMHSTLSKDPRRTCKKLSNHLTSSASWTVCKCGFGFGSSSTTIHVFTQ